MSDMRERCIYCGCTRNENGKWASLVINTDHAIQMENRDSICSSCSTEKFPQYYAGGNRPGRLDRLKYQWLNMLSHFSR